MPKLQISEITIRNFRSYGDYDTTIKLAGLGPVLIIGQKEDDITQSNGVGKSTLADSIVWNLFGRLPSKDKPSDWVINHFVGNNCSVKLTTYDGYIVTRTRNMDGHDDLLITDPSGKDLSLSTNIETQLYLNRLFDLDYDIFTTSVFFAQFGQPFMELNDQKRKRALERMLNLTKFDYYAIVAKEKVESFDKKLMALTSETELFDKNIIKIGKQIEDNNDQIGNHEAERQSRIEEVRTKLSGVDAKYVEKTKDIEDKVAYATTELNNIKTYDISKLQKDWELVEKIKIKLSEEETKIGKLRTEVVQLESEKSTLGTTTFHSFEDQIKQNNNKTVRLKSELETMKQYDTEDIKKQWSEHDDIESQITTLNKTINELKQKLAGFESEVNMYKAEILKWKGKSGNICSECHQVVPENIVRKESSPYISKLATAKKKFDDCQSEIDEHSTEVTKLQKKLVEPDVTVAVAESVNEQYQSKKTQVEEAEASSVTLKEQQKEAVKKAADIQNRIKNIGVLTEGKNKAIQERQTTLDGKKTTLESKKPKITVNEASLLKQQYDAKVTEINLLRESLTKLDEMKQKDKDNYIAEIDNIKAEINPYETIKKQSLKELDDIKLSKEEINKKILTYNLAIKHLTYIQRAYTDRKRIKAFVLSKLIPFFNERIKYYLDAFECETTFEFNSFLQLKNDMWPYELWSGGERKRIDLAVMLAIHDLHESIYEKQCNILVFDEVDGRLDTHGIHNFVNLLDKDFVDQENSTTILIISHKDQMKDIFPVKINVRMVNKLSYIEEIR